MSSVNLTAETRHKLKAAIQKLLMRRCTMRSPPGFDGDELAAITFQKAEDFELMRAFKARFGLHFRAHDRGSIECRVEITSDCTLEWTLSLTDMTIEFPKNGNHNKLYRERDPVVHDKLMEWIEIHKMIMLEYYIGITLTDEAIAHCGTTSQLNWLWPQLLKLDRSGKLEQLSEASRPIKQPTRKPWRETWMGTISQWLAEGTLLGELRSDQQSLHRATPLGHGGALYFDAASVHKSVMNNFKGLRIDPDGQRLPEWGHW